MSKIINEPKNRFPLIKKIRELLEHRALWMYLLCDEARKQGLDPERFAPAAVRRCGLYHGKNIVDGGNSRSLRVLRKKLFGLPGRLVFEMKVRRSTDDNFDVDFSYCPLVKAWQKQGCSDTEMDRMCDFAMWGDRGIAESFGCELELRKTIARGDGVCEIRFKRKDS
ncbi:MAG: L-2-amino-thiazoline-4-carboxylic acid hydrolase [Spirochaetaceae bacterium]|jgi:hypothetical protein|nr:L-2-amino-thiazoline-4-carboxylic acid hydrolase [Spirochaetaceae bacterium]